MYPPSVGLDYFLKKHRFVSMTLWIVEGYCRFSSRPFVFIRDHEKRIFFIQWRPMSCRFRVRFRRDFSLSLSLVFEKQTRLRGIITRIATCTVVEGKEHEGKGTRYFWGGNEFYDVTRFVSSGLSAGRSFQEILLFLRPHRAFQYLPSVFTGCP